MTSSRRRAEALDRATDLRVRYVAALIDGDQEASSRVLEEGRRIGLGTETLLLEVLGAGQRDLGELWHRGEVTVAQEHWGTARTRELVERLLVHHERPAHLGRRAVVTAVWGEVHSLPARLVAALLWGRGWDVDFLGLCPPIPDFARYIAERGADLVALSLTQIERRDSVRETARVLRELENPPPILVGGAAAAGLSPEDLDVDAVARDARSGLRLAEQLVGLGDSPDLPAYLALVGRRIQSLRKRARASQADLAERSGLTRSYLSMVENGRQNFTLEAALRIATALRVEMADLLDARPS